MTRDQGQPAVGAGPSREYRAATAFLIGGVYTLLVALSLAGGVLYAAPAIGGALGLLSAMVGGVALVATAVGLASARRWATAVSTPMLVLIVGAAIIDFALAVTRNSLNIPITGLLAVWALRAPIRNTVKPGNASRARAAVGLLPFGALLLSTAWPLVSSGLLHSGGAFIVASDALQPSLVMTCDGAPDRPPSSVTVRYDWHWFRAEPWAAGFDSVTLAAYTNIEDGASGYALEVGQASSAGVWESDQMIRSPQGAVFGIDLTQARFEPGWVGINLVQMGTPESRHGTVDVQATYLHAPADTSGPGTTAVWRVRTESSCTW